jgi:hypothetical protein
VGRKGRGRREVRMRWQGKVMRRWILQLMARTRAIWAGCE